GLPARDAESVDAVPARRVHVEREVSRLPLIVERQGPFGGGVRVDGLFEAALAEREDVARGVADREDGDGKNGEEREDDQRPGSTKAVRHVCSYAQPTGTWSNFLLGQKGHDPEV